MVDALCHPDDLAGVGILFGWITANSLCHPDDILFPLMSSGWLNWGWYLIRRSCGNAIMSSGWDTLPFSSHSDEIANFDFPQHTMALQCFSSVHKKLRHVNNYINRLYWLNKQLLLMGSFTNDLNLDTIWYTHDVFSSLPVVSQEI